MELNLTRPLLFFDIESTGLDIPVNSIVELSFVKVLPGSEQRIKTWRICPWDYENKCQRKMEPSASEVNGIKDEDVAGEKKFYELADEIASWLEDSDLAGYNSAKFDLPMLSEEFERAKYYCRGLSAAVHNLDLHSKKMIDVQTIYHKMEPRNLKAAYRFYCGGEDFENAHSAEADTLATYEVLKGELDRYDSSQIKNNVDWLAEFTTSASRNVDFAGRIILDSNKQPVINFGKHKGKTCRQVYKEESSYFDWVQRADFCFDTKRQFAIIKQELDQEMSSPLEGEQISQAASMLHDRFSRR